MWFLCLASATCRSRPGALALPDAASQFAGMVSGEVLAKRDDGQLVLRVQKVTDVWSHSQAKDPQALVGKRVLINASQADGKPIESIERFMASLKVGGVVTIDVAHQRGEALTIVELTDEQRSGSQ